MASINHRIELCLFWIQTFWYSKPLSTFFYKQLLCSPWSRSSYMLLYIIAKVQYLAGSYVLHSSEFSLCFLCQEDARGIARNCTFWILLYSSSITAVSEVFTKEHSWSVTAHQSFSSSRPGAVVLQHGSQHNIHEWWDLGSMVDINIRASGGRSSLCSIHP